MKTLKPQPKSGIVEDAVFYHLKLNKHNDLNRFGNLIQIGHRITARNELVYYYMLISIYIGIILLSISFSPIFRSIVPGSMQKKPFCFCGLLHTMCMHIKTWSNSALQQFKPIPCCLILLNLFISMGCIFYFISEDDFFHCISKKNFLLKRAVFENQLNWVDIYTKAINI